MKVGKKTKHNGVGIKKEREMRWGEKPVEISPRSFWSFLAVELGKGPSSSTNWKSHFELDESRQPNRQIHYHHLSPFIRRYLYTLCMI